MLSNSIANPVLPFGSTVTLMCTALLPSGLGIDVSLNVNFELLRTDPSGSLLTTSSPVLAAESTYITTVAINSFGRSDSGVYTCRTSVSSAFANSYISDSNTESHSIRVTTGETCYYYHDNNIIVIIIACIV